MLRYENVSLEGKPRSQVIDWKSPDSINHEIAKGKALAKMLRWSQRTLGTRARSPASSKTLARR